MRNVAVVTGGASGIGHAIVQRLAGSGTAVVVADSNATNAQRVCEDLVAKGGEAAAVIVDVSDPSAPGECLDLARSRYGGCNWLVNNAGVLRLSPAADTSDEMFWEVMQTNLYGVFSFSRAFARELIERGEPGAIVNISSIHAVISEPNGAAYTAAKGAVEAMSRTMASEWARHRIRVNFVRPGATRTALTTDLYTPEVLAALKLRVPMQEVANPDQVAAAVHFLLSEEASYITGSNLDVDGGYIMDGSLPGLVYS
jgi:NAD(P)-dependent dehydrogenase (short-subunit alcohol dehydrogenase family)